MASAPLLLLLHPYAGLTQDARIYVGRGVADRDPGGVGRDMLFSDDGQTGFSLLREAVRVALHVASPATVSASLALAGSLAWLLALTALVRRVAATCPGVPSTGRAGWAMAVAAVALPARYGAFGLFAYAETSATPRIFAEAAALGGLAALLGTRPRTGGMLLLLALAIHPLMALPALGLAAVLLVRADRRWLWIGAASAAVLLLAGLLGAPVVGRLFAAMDATWWSILRERNPNLFPSLWSADDFARLAPRAAAAVVAGSLVSARARALLWGSVGIGGAGVGLAALFGDLLPDELITQIQPWRALWLPVLLGNAGLPLVAVALFRRGPPARLVLAVLALAWCADAAPPVAMALSAAAAALAFALHRGLLDRVRPRIAAAALALAGVAMAGTALRDGAALLALLRSSAEQGGDVTSDMIVAAGAHAVPIVLGAVLIAAARPRPTARPLLVGAALLPALLAAALLWDQRSSERRGFEEDAGVAELRDFFAPTPGAVLWIDESAETWFDLGRPAFFNALQGAPILFSRDLAYDWASRGAGLRRLGLARAFDLAPWSSPDGRRQDLPLTPDAVRGFCADPRRPAGLVAPGDQAAAVPPGFPVLVWRPPFAIRRLVVDGDGIGWRPIDAFTAVRCG